MSGLKMLNINFKNHMRIIFITWVEKKLYYTIGDQSLHLIKMSFEKYQILLAQVYPAS